MFKLRRIASRLSVACAMGLIALAHPAWSAPPQQWLEGVRESALALQQLRLEREARLAEASQADSLAARTTATGAILGAGPGGGTMSPDRVPAPEVLGANPAELVRLQ